MPSSAGISLTKLSLSGNNLNFNVASDIPAGDGNVANLFLQCTANNKQLLCYVVLTETRDNQKPKLDNQRTTYRKKIQEDKDERNNLFMPNFSQLDAENERPTARLYFSQRIIHIIVYKLGFNNYKPTRPFIDDR